MTIPADSQEGYYYIGILVDRTYDIPKLYESNDYVSTEAQIQVYHMK